MKKWLLIFLAVGTAQAACPAHPGYILNGRIQQLTGLQVICGQLLTVFKNEYRDSPAKWVELYAVKNSANPTELARKMNSIFTSIGFTQIQDKSPSSTERIFGYTNISAQKIISMYIFVTGSIVYISFSGT